MTQSQPVSEAESNHPPAPTRPTDPRKNPSYPQREHIHERAHWQGVLRSCDERIEAALRKLGVLGPDASNRGASERLHAQMLGARDQVYDAARRLPGEAGDLYTEDLHRLEEAVAALDRVLRQFDAAK